MIALSNAAPIYNLVFVLIAVYLFIKLFLIKGKEYVRLFPWKLIFVALFIKSAVFNPGGKNTIIL